MRIVQMPNGIVIEVDKDDTMLVGSLGNDKPITVDILDTDGNIVTLNLDRVAAWRLTRELKEITGE